MEYMPPCQEVDPEQFFPERRLEDGKTNENYDAQVNELRIICGSCAMASECLTRAMDLEVPTPRSRFGVWGGFTPAERRQLYRDEAMQHESSVDKDKPSEEAIAAMRVAQDPVSLQRALAVLPTNASGLLKRMVYGDEPIEDAEIDLDKIPVLVTGVMDDYQLAQPHSSHAKRVVKLLRNTCHELVDGTFDYYAWAKSYRGQFSRNALLFCAQRKATSPEGPMEDVQKYARKLSEDLEIRGMRRHSKGLLLDAVASMYNLGPGEDTASLAAIAAEMGILESVLERYIWVAVRSQELRVA